MRSFKHRSRPLIKRPPRCFWGPLSDFFRLDLRLKGLGSRCVLGVSSFSLSCSNNQQRGFKPKETAVVTSEPRLSTKSSCGLAGLGLGRRGVKQLGKNVLEPIPLKR